MSAELNYLLVERPGTAAPEDFGWFCREHAFCTAALGAIFGWRFAIVRGGILIHTNSAVIRCLRKNGDEHVWCSLSSRPLIDLSANFFLFPRFPQLNDPVVQLGRNGDFDIKLIDEESASKNLNQDGCRLEYISGPTTSVSPSELVPWAAKELLQPDAMEIACRVALHTAGVLTGHAPSLIGTRLNQQECLHFLSNRIPNSTEILHRTLCGLSIDEMQS